MLYMNLAKIPRDPEKQGSHCLIKPQSVIWDECKAGKLVDLTTKARKGDSQHFDNKSAEIMVTNHFRKVSPLHVNLGHF